MGADAETGQLITIPAAERVPVLVLTGFLGSGKTSLLRDALRSPDFKDTAVIINEFGEMGLDHLLIDTSSDQFVEMSNGCICCAGRLDIAATLQRLLRRRQRRLASFRRIVVETSGLADPSPIMSTIASDPMLGHEVRMAGVVCLVDTTSGSNALRHHLEARAQVATADRIIFTKTDLAEVSEDLSRDVTRLNRWASRLSTSLERDAPALLFQPFPALAHPKQAETCSGRHSSDISTFSFVLQEPQDRRAFVLSMGAFARHHGHNLLRVKGLVEFKDRTDAVAVIQGVHHTLYRPEWLSAWPDGDRRSRMVFILKDTSEEPVLEHFADWRPILWTQPPRPFECAPIAAEVIRMREG